MTKFVTQMALKSVVRADNYPRTSTRICFAITTVLPRTKGDSDQTSDQFLKYSAQ